MDISKLNKTSLEDILREIMCDLEKTNKPLEEKYKDLICNELYYIDDTEAKTIVKSMKPYGEVFTMQDIETILSTKQIPEIKCIKYYLCMNMFYNDYKAYIDLKKLEPREFCFEMSKLFINDIDAPKHKVEKYFKDFEEN